MASIEIRGSPKRVIKIGHKEASELKDEWFRMKEGKRLAEILDLGEWSGPWSKIVSIDLAQSNLHSVSEVLLESGLSSSCCNDRVFADVSGKGFRCGACDCRCTYKVKN
jgi:hypothetical protein